MIRPEEPGELPGARRHGPVCEPERRATGQRTNRSTEGARMPSRRDKPHGHALLSDALRNK